MTEVAYVYTLHAYRPGDMEFEALCGAGCNVAVTSVLLVKTFGVNCGPCLAVVEAEGLGP